MLMLTNQSIVLSKSNRNRDRLAIVSSMLSCARGGVIKTKLMYDVGLSWAQLENYLPGLVKSGLLEITEDHGKRLYRITKKGWIFLDAYSVLISLLDLQNQVDARLVLSHEGKECNERYKHCKDASSN
jgi:predicted transcriptional regulator